MHGIAYNDLQRAECASYCKLTFIYRTNMYIKVNFKQENSKKQIG